MLDNVVTILLSRPTLSYELPIPPGFRPELPTDDDVSDPPIDDVLGQAFAMTYIDSKGRRSERRVTIRSVRNTAAGHTTITGYCHERKAARTFRLDRVEQLVDLATGEVFAEPASVLSGLMDIQGVNEAIHRCRYELQVLAYVGRCDGEFDELEQDWIADYIAARNEHLSLDHRELTQAVARTYPDTYSFHASLTQLANSMDDPAAFLRTLRRVVDADGLLHEREHEVVEAINAAIADR